MCENSCGFNFTEKSISFHMGIHLENGPVGYISAEEQGPSNKCPGYVKLLSFFLLRCGTRPYERGTQ